MSEYFFGKLCLMFLLGSKSEAPIVVASVGKDIRLSRKKSMVSQVFCGSYDNGNLTHHYATRVLCSYQPSVPTQLRSVWEMNHAMSKVAIEQALPVSSMLVCDVYCCSGIF